MGKMTYGVGLGVRYNEGMAKKKRPQLVTPRMPERMQRHKQTAHTFVDRKKKASREACRGKVYA